jgi:CO/xanthine dehydrogenase Mo-binding subunit
VIRNLALQSAHNPVADVEKGFREADFIIEEKAFTTSRNNRPWRCFCCVASFDAGGKLTLWSPTQLPFLMRRMVAYIFDLPEGKVRVRNEYTGGGFGAGLTSLKNLYAFFFPENRASVKLVYSRQEEFASRPTRSCASLYRLKMGVNKDGTITAVERKVTARAGAHIECAAFCSMVGCSMPIHCTGGKVLRLR